MRVQILDTDFECWFLTTERAESCHGQPVLLIEKKGTGESEVFGPGDLMPCCECGAHSPAREVLSPMLKWENLGADRRQAIECFCALPV